MIQGDKVTLRAIEPADVPLLWQWAQDEETMRFRDYPTPPSSLALAEKEYADYVLDKSGCTLRLAITAEDGRLIGDVALRSIDERAGSAIFVIAIGDKSFWGHGYGSDATRCMIKYAFKQLNLHRVTLYVHSFNSRAIRVYEKCGFRREGIIREGQYMDGEYSDILIMGVLRREFEELERRNLPLAA
jgi:RimJ/RimL family protein N-acetyltransferase